jgi:hypothetical protein
MSSFAALYGNTQTGRKRFLSELQVLVGQEAASGRRRAARLMRISMDATSADSINVPDLVFSPETCGPPASAVAACIFPKLEMIPEFNFNHARA